MLPYQATVTGRAISLLGFEGKGVMNFGANMSLVRSAKRGAAIRLYWHRMPCNVINSVKGMLCWILITLMVNLYTTLKHILFVFISPYLTSFRIFLC